MQTIDNITIGEAKALCGMFGAVAAPKPATNHGLQIAILDRGFVFVGDVVSDGDWTTITNAQCVRRWGTTKGLGELAARGPLKDTVLDPTGVVKAPARALIGLIACEAASWKR